MPTYHIWGRYLNGIMNNSENDSVCWNEENNHEMYMSYGTYFFHSFSYIQKVWHLSEIKIIIVPFQQLESVIRYSIIIVNLQYNQSLSHLVSVVKIYDRLPWKFMLRPYNDVFLGLSKLKGSYSEQFSLARYSQSEHVNKNSPFQIVKNCRYTPRQT